MKSLLLIFIMITIFSGCLTAQINKTERDLIIDSLCSKLVKYYIYPENAEKAIQFIRRKQETKSYDTIFDEQTFAAQITSDLRQAGNDEHLRLEYSEDVISEQNENPYMLTDEEVEEVRQFVIQENFGIRKIDILKGNIGFIDFSGIFGADQAGEKYAAIMDYLSHTDALIIDLRSCRGAMGSDGISFWQVTFLKSRFT